ncbi:MAG: GlxA family transcriptional regulator [Marinobacterium sp.]|nr:GlxA family transcriptional regulator [Marinobacterium sp.]
MSAQHKASTPQGMSATPDAVTPQERRQFSGRLRDTNSPFLPAAQNGERTVRVGFVLLEHFSLMAFTAAVDALVTANLVSTTPLFSVSSYGLGSTAIRSDLGIDITSNSTLDRVCFEGHSALDILIICGGFRCALGEFPKLTQCLHNAARQQRTLGGLWNGAIPLAHAGLLNDRQCALHPDNHALLGEQFPHVQLSDKAMVIEPDRLTSAGPNSALEMMLALIEQLRGPEIVRAIREILSCDRNHQHNHPLTHPTSQQDDPALPELLRELLQLMRNNIEEPLTIDELASCAGISRRRIERLFQAHLEATPSRYYLELRITHARRLLLQSSDSIATIAAACGFLSSTHFSHCFKDYFGASPSQVRQQHQQQPL